MDSVSAEALEDAVSFEYCGDGRFEAGEVQLDAVTLREVEDLRELRGALGVDEVGALQVQHHRAQGRVGMERELTDAFLERVGSPFCTGTPAMPA